MKPIYFLMFVVAIILGGCANPTIGSVAGGECKLTHTPAYAVRGKTEYDQEWVDDTTEALVRGCKQPRPKARPVSLDAPKVVTRPAAEQAPIATPAPLVKKKHHWWTGKGQKAKELLYKLERKTPPQ